MSSRFISAGEADAKAPEGLSNISDDAWEKARQQVEQARRPTELGPVPGTQEGGKSLYEHLQDQKAAKQEAFEEATKVKNQFRPLDDGEVEFLEGIKRDEKAHEADVRKETAQQLEAFRKVRAAAELEAEEHDLEQDSGLSRGEVAGEIWTTTKKRRRARDDEAARLSKVRRLPSREGAEVDTSAQRKSGATTLEKPVTTQVSASGTEHFSVEEVSHKPTAAAHPLTLVGYDSDSEG